MGLSIVTGYDNLHKYVFASFNTSPMVVNRCIAVTLTHVA